MLHCTVISFVVDIRDMFEPNGSGRLCSIIRHFFSAPAEEMEECRKFALVKACFRCSKIMSKSENNKGNQSYNSISARHITAFGSGLDAQRNRRVHQESYPVR